jgi:hypothetical protein
MEENMLIVVEGMDNTGKSTLAQHIAEKFKIVLMANKQRPRSVSEAIRYTSIVRTVSSIFPVIVDRWAPISEPVYGPILRGENLAEGISDEADLIIYCRPPIEVIMNYGNREQMPGVIENTREIVAAYDELMSRKHYVLYDYTNPITIQYVEDVCSKM